MTNLPEPLTPGEADLRDFRFMPLEIFRLRRSKAWLACKRRPELAFYMLNLWTASWHERPAGSLEDDDDVLADLAMCSPEKWPKVRDAVLRGWAKCQDGRLYHPVVAEKVVEAWSAKVAQRLRTIRGRIVALEKRIAECVDPKKKNLMNQDLLALSQELSQSQSQSSSPPINKSGQGRPQSPSTPTTEAKRQGQGQGERQGQGYIYTGTPATEPVTARGEKGRYPDPPANPPGGGDFEFVGELDVEPTDAEHHARFQQAMAKYPEYSGEVNLILVESACRRIVTSGEGTWDDIDASCERFAKFVAAKGRSGPEYVHTPLKHFSDAALWRGEWKPPKSKSDRRIDNNLDAAEQARRELEQELQQ